MKPYRPGSGTEGVAFIGEWCGNCQRDEHEDCQILADSFAFDITDPNYPKEWVEDEVAGPRCTAFAPYGEPAPYRCAKTSDMFGRSPQDHTPPESAAVTIIVEKS